MILAAEFPAIPWSAVKIASERRCAILVHSVADHWENAFVCQFWWRACLDQLIGVLHKCVELLAVLGVLVGRWAAGPLFALCFHTFTRQELF